MSIKLVSFMSVLLIILCFYLGQAFIRANNINLSFFKEKTTQPGKKTTGNESKNIQTGKENAKINEDRVLPKDIEVRFKNNGTLLLGELIKGRNTTLILRIDDRQCTDCISAAVRAFKVASAGTNVDGMIILGRFQTRSAEKFYRDKFKSETNFYSCEALPIPAESALTPYFLKIDSTLKIKQAFFPIKEETDYNVNNLKKILQ